MYSSFLDIDDEFKEYDKASVYILPVPYERTTSYMKGTANGPSAILDASVQLENFDTELLYEPYRSAGGVHTAPPFPVYHKTPEEFIEDLKNHVEKVLDDNKFPIILGGEHTISLAPFLAALKKYPDCSVLHIDAHSDLRDSYEGTPYNHACVMRRIREHTDRTVSLGIRSVPKEDYLLIKEQNIPVYFIEQAQGNLPELDKVLSHLSEHVYLTIDIDGLDPSVMPAVGTPEPGGIKWEQLLKTLKGVFEARNVVACDIVELNPSEALAYADFTAAKLLYKLIGYKFL